jgi:hypothetical protein
MSDLKVRDEIPWFVDLNSNAPTQFNLSCRFTAEFDMPRARPPVL